jgi:hypothetical protein
MRRPLSPYPLWQHVRLATQLKQLHAGLQQLPSLTHPDTFCCRSLCRLMVQTQMVWVSELSSATGRSSYGISSTAIQVHLPEALVDSCSLGQVVHVIGHAHTSVVTGAANRAVVQVGMQGGVGRIGSYVLCGLRVNRICLLCLHVLPIRSVTHR